MALSADEGVKQGGVASSFGIRSPVGRPGNVIAPMVGGVQMVRFGIEWVFVLVGVFALSGVTTFLGVLFYSHRRRALSTW